MPMPIFFNTIRRFYELGNCANLTRRFGGLLLLFIGNIFSKALLDLRVLYRAGASCDVVIRMNVALKAFLLARQLVIRAAS